MNEVKRYVNTVERYLRLDRRTRLRVMNDLASDLQSRLDAGETLEDIRADLGDARTLAETLNREFADHRDNASPWRWAFLVLAIFLALVFAVNGLSARQEAASIGIIGGADGPTAIYVTTQYSLMSGLRDLAWLVTLVGGYWLLGPARRGSRKRLLVPMILCGAACLLQLICIVGYMSSVGGDPLTMLRFLVSNVAVSGIWLSGLLLWQAVRAWRRR